MIRLKLAIWNSVVLIFVTCGLALMISRVNRANLLSSVDRELESRATRISKALAGAVLQSDQPRFPIQLKEIGKVAQSGRAQFLEMQQELFAPRVFDSHGRGYPIDAIQSWDKAALEDVRSGKVPQQFSTTEWIDPRDHNLTVRLRVYTIRFKTHSNEDYFSQFASNVSVIETEIEHLNHTIWTMLPLTIVVSICMGILLTSHAL